MGQFAKSVTYDLYLRLLAETFLITAKIYTENAETILNYIKNPAKTLPKCRNPHLPKLPKPCQNYSKHIVKSCRNLSQDFGEVLASNLSYTTHRHFVFSFTVHFYILSHNSASIAPRNMKLPPFNSSYWDESNKLYFVSLRSLDAEICNKMYFFNFVNEF